MKRFASLIALLLCLAFALPCAMAEETYIPGARSQALAAEAWNAGKILRGDLSLRLEVDAAALGLGEEETQALDALLPLLDRITLGFGAGKTETGIRIVADAEMENANGGAPVSADAAANIDLYGISVESDLIPGRRVTSRWETLLAMTGMSDDTISILLMARDTNWEVMLPQLMTIAESYIQLGIQYAAPYGEIVTSWAAALPMTLEAVATPEGYPATASNGRLNVTDKDILNLAAQLAGHLKEDIIVSTLVDRVIQEFSVEISQVFSADGHVPNVDELCDAVIAAANAHTEPTLIFTLTYGADEAGIPCYALAELSNAVSQNILGIALTKTPEGHLTYALSAGIIETPDTETYRFTCAGELAHEHMSADAKIVRNGQQVLGLLCQTKSVAAEGELPGLKTTQNVSMVVDDGYITGKGVSTALYNYSLTAEGGEVMDSTVITNFYTGDTQATNTVLLTQAIFPAENGFTGSTSYLHSQPSAGINTFGADVILGCEAYDPATTLALKETAFETASKAVINDLLTTVMENGQFKLISLMQAVPPEALTHLLRLAM